MQHFRNLRDGARTRKSKIINLVLLPPSFLCPIYRIQSLARYPSTSRNLMSNEVQYDSISLAKITARSEVEHCHERSSEYRKLMAV